MHYVTCVPQTLPHMPTLSKDGRIRIPADLRRRHGWTPGQELEAVDAGSGIVIRPVSADPLPFPLVDDAEFHAVLKKLREGIKRSGSPIPLEKLGIDGPDGLDYYDVYPDGP